MTNTTNPQRPEVDDPRVLALATARQQLAHRNPFNAVCPPWDGLSEQEQHLSLLDARSYLHAAMNAGLVPDATAAASSSGRAALLHETADAGLRDRIAEELAAHFSPDGEITRGMRVIDPDDEDDPEPARRVLPIEAADVVAELLRRVAAETQDSAPSDWIDGHPQLEAIAAAVWERCEHHDSGLIVDDPRNIAVAALAAVLAAPADGPRRVAAEEQPAETQAHSCRNCEGIDPDTCWTNPNRPPEQCPRSEFDGYGLQCQKPAGHNLCTFEEEAAATERPVVGEQPDTQDLAGALRIVASWYEDVNDRHGLDAGDLVHDLEQAGYALPDGPS